MGSHEGSAFGVYEGPSLNHIFGTDVLGNDLFSQCVEAFALTIVQVAGMWILVVVPALILTFKLGEHTGPISSISRALFEALGGIPPIFILLVVTFYGYNSLWVQSLVIYAVLYPETMRRLLHASDEIGRMSFVRSARLMGLPGKVVQRWYILPAIYGKIVSVGETLAVRIIVLSATLGFLGYGSLGSLNGFGELLRNNRIVFVSEDAVLPLVFLLVSVLSTLSAVLGLQNLAAKRIRRKVDGGSN